MAEQAEGAPLLREYGVKSSIEGSNPSLTAIVCFIYSAPVAQLDRVLGYEPSGQRFESFRVRHFHIVTFIKIFFTIQHIYYISFLYLFIFNYLKYEKTIFTNQI